MSVFEVKKSMTTSLNFFFRFFHKNTIFYEVFLAPEFFSHETETNVAAPHAPSHNWVLNATKSLSLSHTHTHAHAISFSHSLTLLFHFLCACFGKLMHSAPIPLTHLSLSLSLSLLGTHVGCVLNAWRAQVVNFCARAQCPIRFGFKPSVMPSCAPNSKPVSIVQGDEMIRFSLLVAATFPKTFKPVLESFL